MFAFLKRKHNSELVLDPSEPNIEYDQFKVEDWTNTPYGKGCVDEGNNFPEPRGLGFKIIAYCDADHAGDMITRRSRTGFIVYLNNSPIYWLSKKQASVETSSYGSEFTAMKHCCEYLRGLRFKLKMMGIPCAMPSFIFGDNKSVLINSTVPHSALKKKSCAISYHFIRDGVSKDEWRIAYVPSDQNRADILSKPIAGGMKRERLTSMILHHTM